MAIVSRARAAEWLALSSTTLVRFEARGLVTPVREGDVEGYGPEEVRRLHLIVSYQRDLGMNLAGVEVALKLRDQLVAVHRRLDAMAQEFSGLLSEGPADDPDEG